MKKLVAIICVISWSGFWSFGYLALSARIEDQRQMVIAALLAGVGLISGTIAYLKLAKGAR